MYNLISTPEYIPAAEQMKNAEMLAEHRAAYRARRAEGRRPVLRQIAVAAIKRVLRWWFGPSIASRSGDALTR